MLGPTFATRRIRSPQVEGPTIYGSKFSLLVKSPHVLSPAHPSPSPLEFHNSVKPFYFAFKGLSPATLTHEVFGVGFMYVDRFLPKHQRFVSVSYKSRH